MNSLPFFLDRGVVPPEPYDENNKGEFTLGELDFKIGKIPWRLIDPIIPHTILVNISSPSDQNIGVFTQSGVSIIVIEKNSSSHNLLKGSIYPHIMIPHRAPKEKRFRIVEASSQQQDVLGSVKSWIRRTSTQNESALKRYIVDPILSLFRLSYVSNF